MICTLGPASRDRKTLQKMVLAGMDAVRLNFSHGSLAEHYRMIEKIRHINRAYGSHIRILADLEGHRIRIGKLKGSRPITLKKGSTLWLAQDGYPIKAGTVPFDYSGDLKGIRMGQSIFIDDGNIALTVTGRKRKALKTRVIVGGLLKERKGVNIPGANLKFKGISEKDLECISFAMENRVDMIAQSFVNNKEDVLAVAALLGPARSAPRIVAKIESRGGIRNIDDIIKASDGIMVARGDMGISIPVYQVPMVQKSIIKKCNRAKKFVITATQMLESMTENRIPTRAEVTDVANAVLDGTDYVMLSAETAVGKYPVETVRMMEDIIRYTESHSG